MERPVELAVAAAVEPVALLLAARRVDWAGAGERGEGCLACHPPRVAAGDEQLRRTHGADAALVEQFGCRLGDQAASARSISWHLACQVAGFARPIRRSTSLAPRCLAAAEPPRARAASWARAPRRCADRRAVVTITASSWLSAALRACIAPRRSSKSTRSCSRRPAPRGRLSPSPLTTRPSGQERRRSVVLPAPPLPAARAAHTQTPTRYGQPRNARAQRRSCPHPSTPNAGHPSSRAHTSSRR